MSLALVVSLQKQGFEAVARVRDVVGGLVIRVEAAGDVVGYDVVGYDVVGYGSSGGW